MIGTESGMVMVGLYCKARSTPSLHSKKKSESVKTIEEKPGNVESNVPPIGLIIARWYDELSGGLIIARWYDRTL